MESATQMPPEATDEVAFQTRTARRADLVDGRRRPRALNDKRIAELKPRAAAYEVADPGCRGLVLKVQPTGTKTFRYRLRAREGVRARGQIITIGRWGPEPGAGCLGIREAQKWVEQLRRARALGDDAFTQALEQMRRQLQPERLEPAADGPRTVAQEAEAWLRVIDGQRKRPEVARYVMTKNILPFIGQKALAELRKSDCRAVVERVAERAPTHAGKVLSTLKQFLGFAARNNDDFISPAAAFKPKDLEVKQSRRKRRLEDPKELRAFWRACETSEAMEYNPPDEVFRIAFRLLLLTAVRTGELRQARWSDIDLEAGVWTVPIEHQKLTLAQASADDAEPFRVPLTSTSLALFRRLKELAGESVYAFPARRLRRRGEKPKSELLDEKVIGKAMRRMWNGNAELKNRELARPHDLRRTARTWLGNLGVPPHIAEGCLNHSFGGVRKAYDRGEYFEMRREALQKWDAFLAGVVAAQP